MWPYSRMAIARRSGGRANRWCADRWVHDLTGLTTAKCPKGSGEHGRSCSVWAAFFAVFFFGRDLSHRDLVPVGLEFLLVLLTCSFETTPGVLTDMNLASGIFALLLLSGCAVSTHSPKTDLSPAPRETKTLKTKTLKGKNMKSNQALLVLDMQNDFGHPAGKMHGMVKDELKRTNVVESSLRWIRSAQEKGVLTIVSPIHFDYSQPPSTAPEGIAGPITELRAFDGTKFGGELLEDFERLTHEDNVLKMVKPSLSAFAGTELNNILKQRGVEEIVVAGLLTNFCVENTVRDAFDLGYRVRVVSDATATFNGTQQGYAMETIFPMLGRVITVDEFSAAGASTMP